VLPEDYDKALCIIPEETLAFIKTTQPKAYQRLEKQYGEDTPHKLIARIAKQVTQFGTLHVLRKGVKDRGENFN
jgi:type I restriction enzyme, R subunit